MQVSSPTCTKPFFLSIFLVGSIGMRLGLQFFVIGNLIFCGCGTFTKGATGLVVPGCNGMRPGGGAEGPVFVLDKMEWEAGIRGGLFNCDRVMGEFLAADEVGIAVTDRAGCLEEDKLETDVITGPPIK